MTESIQLSAILASLYLKTMMMMVVVVMMIMMMLKRDGEDEDNAAGKSDVRDDVDWRYFKYSDRKRMTKIQDDRY